MLLTIPNQHFCLQSENDALQRGDVIKKIDDYDTRDMRHVDAQNLLQNSETIKLVVERSESSRATTSSRIITDTTITVSPSTVFKSNFGDGAAVTSLSECNTISIITRFFFYCYHNDIRCCYRAISSPLRNAAD